MLMEVYYHSALNDTEIIPGSVLHTVPCKAYLTIHKDRNEASCEIIYNGTIINPDADKIECNEEAELIIRRDGVRYTYSVLPLGKPLSLEYAKAYDEFTYEYRDKELDEISSIQLGNLKLYAVDRSTEVYDYTKIFEEIGHAFNAFRYICEKPKSHLKAVNEVRPIETVKRIGYESIPYLAAHSEDWLARTASGLKPARLFSRVEEDEYQIYENRVVKTLIDYILKFLREKERQLWGQREQLRGIQNSNVQSGSFGFDVSFQKAVYELMSSDEKGEEYRSKSLELAIKLHEKAVDLLKRYRSLRQTRLYRYLKKSKPVSGLLNETNILTMDRHYKIIFRLWKEMHHVIAKRADEEENPIAFDDTCDNYQKFCATLCGYSAHVLGFDILRDRHYKRYSDNIEMIVTDTEDGVVTVVLKDVEPRTVPVSNVEIPIEPGTEKYGIQYDGNSLIWPNDITDDQIEEFCSIFKTRESRGKEQQEEKKKYRALRQLLDEAQRSYDNPKKICFIIIPTAVELNTENRSSYRMAMEKVAWKIREDHPDTEIVVALPTCNDSEQKITEYAKEEGQIMDFLPLTMFDINSFRRLQNVLYRQILKLGKTTCPNCGGKMRVRDNERICDNCNQLTITETICPNPECRHKYLYMGYEVSSNTLQKMQDVKQKNFFEWDSLYQYKDIVNMTVTTGKIRTVCPYCHQS